jgi:ribosome maturation factor RimP
MYPWNYIVQLIDLIEKTLDAMGYELVELEREAGGLLRVTLDLPERNIDINDCEKVSHQLTHLFTVENIAYERLEVSSPGLDRPLNKVAHFARFVGEEAQVRLKVPLDGRRNFTGMIQEPRVDEAGETLIGLEFEGKDGPALLEFTLADLDKARLVPVLDFKGSKK